MYLYARRLELYPVFIVVTILRTKMGLFKLARKIKKVFDLIVACYRVIG